MPTHLFVLNNFRTWRVDETKVDQVVAMLDSLALPEPGRVPAEPPVKQPGARAGGGV